MRLTCNETERDYWDRAIRLWGPRAVVGMLSEECGELLAAVNQFDRGRVEKDKVAEEIADVLGVMRHLTYQIQVGPLVNAYSDEKFRRFKKLVEDCEGNAGEGK